MLSAKVMIIHLIVGLMKKISLCKMSYFPEPSTCSENKVKVEIELSNYVTKSDFKNAAGVGTSKFAKKVDLANLNSGTDKLYIGKLETTPTDLTKLSNIVNNEFVKNIYIEMVKKLNAIETIDTIDLVKKADCNTKIGGIEKKIPDHDK